MTAPQAARGHMPFPGHRTQVEVAKAMGVPLSTVSSWRQCNQIPTWRQPKVLELALSQGVALSSSDFPPVDARVPFGKADAA